MLGNRRYLVNWDWDPTLNLYYFLHRKNKIPRKQLTGQLLTFITIR